MNKKHLGAAIFAALFIHFQASAEEVRCGWLDNPSPNTWWLVDKDDEWNITQSLESGLSAESWEKLPKFTPDQLSKKNRAIKHGCACLTVDVNSEGYVSKIYSSQVLPLSACRKNKELPHR
jgi:Protein of unknown function (DUF4087)